MTGKIITKNNSKEARKYIGKEVIFFNDEKKYRSSYFKATLKSTNNWGFSFVFDVTKKIELVEKRENTTKYDKIYLQNIGSNAFEKILIPKIIDKNGNYLLGF